MDKLSDIDPVIALLYDGVTSSGDWYDGLDAVAQALGSVGFHYLAMDGQSGAMLDGMATFELPPESVHAYETHYIHDDPRMLLALRQPAGHSWADHDYLDKRVVSGAPIYTDLLIPNGACYTLSLRIRADAERSEFVGYFRPADAPLTRDEEREFLRRLTPPHPACVGVAYPHGHAGPACGAGPVSPEPGAAGRGGGGRARAHPAHERDG